MISLQKLIDDVVEIKFALIVSQLISLEEREQFMTVKFRVSRRTLIRFKFEVLY